MSYQVLARKYRPQTFADVLGQEHVTVTLANALTAKRLHHAYLFTGARGVGKTTVARLLAKALNCEKGPVHEPCGTCRSCQEITSGSSLDVQEIDGASNTSVDDIREIRERVKFLPSSGIYKVYIIDEVHMLSTSAFNALLKTLEEPPAHVVFIFATTEPHRIPATILSRCQRYDFRRIPAALAAEHLAAVAKRESITASPESLLVMAREASGSMRDALSLFDQAIAFSGGAVTVEKIQGMLGFLDRALLFDLLEAVTNHHPHRALEIFHQAFESGTDLVRLGQDILEGLRHLVVIKECGEDARLFDLPRDEVERLVVITRGSTTEELQQMFALWYASANDVARSPFPKMILEVMLLRLCRVEPVRPIGELMARIEELTNAVPTPDVPVPTDDSWPAFQRWLAVNEPRVASILQHGELVALEAKRITLTFTNPLYADMLSEPDRKSRVQAAITSFFKRPLDLVVQQVEKSGETASMGRAKRARELTREALESSIVREATEIFGAAVRDVKPVMKE